MSWRSIWRSAAYMSAARIAAGRVWIPRFGTGIFRRQFDLAFLSAVCHASCCGLLCVTGWHAVRGTGSISVQRAWLVRASGLTFPILQIKIPVENIDFTIRQPAPIFIRFSDSALYSPSFLLRRWRNPLNAIPFLTLITTAYGPNGVVSLSRLALTSRLVGTSFRLGLNAARSGKLSVLRGRSRNLSCRQQGPDAALSPCPSRS